MLKSALLNDKRAVISWLLSQIGLMLAAGILLGAIASLTFYSDWQKEAEAKNIASDFAAAVESMDLKEFSEQIKYMFPQKSYNYRVEISTDYITVIREDGTTTDKIVGREKLIIKPYIRPSEKNWEWNNSQELHDFLKKEYGHSGYADDIFPKDQKDIVTEYMKNELSHTATELASDPLSITNIDEPVCIEKTFIYYEGTDGDSEREGFVIIHQEGN